jgi:hypothetical protein
MRQGMGFGIAIFCRIGQSPDAESIDYEYNDTIYHGRTIPEETLMGYGVTLL